MRTLVCAGTDINHVLQDVDGHRQDGYSPTLALVFCSVARDFRLLSKELGTRGLEVVGTTTAGEIANTEILNEGCVVMLMDAAPESFRVCLESSTAAEGLLAPSERIGAHAIAAFENPFVITFAGGVKADGEAIIHGVRAGAGRNIPHFGGMAGDDLRMVDTYVFTSEAVTDHGVLALIFDGDRYAVSGAVAHGWQPIGVEKTVTRARGNVIYAIDDQRAMTVYQDYLHTIDAVVENANVTTAIGVQYPLSVRRPDGSEVIRPPLFFDPDEDALIFAGAIPEQSKVKFCIPPSVDIVDRVTREAAAVRNGLPQADAVINVSCAARLMALDVLAEDEIRAICELWDAPTAGFFSYGEIGGRGAERCDFHTQSCSLVAIREIRH
jgi:hypothetical protein